MISSTYNILKKLTIAVLLLSVFTSYAYANETDTSTLPTYNSGSDWWVEVTPEDPDYDLYKNVEVNCFCG